MSASKKDGRVSPLTFVIEQQSDQNQKSDQRMEQGSRIAYGFIAKRETGKEQSGEERVALLSRQSITQHPDQGTIKSMEKHIEQMKAQRFILPQ